MAVSPRSVEEIVESMGDTMDGIDPTIDTTKGPIAVLLYAFSAELTRAEQMAGYLSILYNLEQAEDIDDDDVENIGNNYGLDPDVGRLADVIITYYRLSRPEEGLSYKVYEGDLVGSEDGRFIFAVTEDVTMDGDNADVYFNADEQRYEINVPAQSVSVGDDFNLTEGTINTLFTPSADFDGATNPDPAQNGEDPLSKMEFRNIVWNNLQALDSDMAGNLIQTVLDADPVGIKDVRLLGSTDYANFERLSVTRGRTAYDIYVITDTITPEVMTYTALGGETVIPIENSPVQSVQYVNVDGVPVPFAFLPDLRKEYRRSPRADDRVELTGDDLQPGQIVEVKYFYYSKINDAQTQIEGGQKPFGNDVLTRLAYPIPVFIAAKLLTDAAEDRDRVEANILDFTDSYMKDPVSPSPTRVVFPDTMDPRDYEDQVESTIPGVASFNVINFNRLDNAVRDVAVIEFNGVNEYAVLSPNFLII